MTRKTRMTTAIRFSTDLHRKLKTAAEERSVSINYLVVKASEDFLDRLLPADQVRWTK